MPKKIFTEEEWQAQSDAFKKDAALPPRKRKFLPIEAGIVSYTIKHLNEEIDDFINYPETSRLLNWIKIGLDTFTLYEQKTAFIDIIKTRAQQLLFEAGQESNSLSTVVEIGALKKLLSELELMTEGAHENKYINTIILDNQSPDIDINNSDGHSCTGINAKKMPSDIQSKAATNPAIALMYVYLNKAGFFSHRPRKPYFAANISSLYGKSYKSIENVFKTYNNNNNREKPNVSEHIKSAIALLKSEDTALITTNGERNTAIAHAEKDIERIKNLMREGGST